MKIKDIKHKIQSIFGVTKNEINAVSVILLGMLISLVITMSSYYNTHDSQEINKDNSKAILTQLAHKQQSEYLGSDMNGYPDPELAKNLDTSSYRQDSPPRNSRRKKSSHPV